KRGIGDSTLAQVAEYQRKEDTDLFTAAKMATLSGRARTQMNKFLHIIESGIQKNKTSNAYENADYIANNSGIIKAFKDENTVESLNRIENIEALLNGIKDFVDEDEMTDLGMDMDMIEERTLATYIQHIALLTDQDRNQDETDQVTLMSVHAAKGLEFDAVFLVGLEEKLFPSFMSMENEKDIDEERRLFYVAITRARQHLVLAFSSSRYRYGKLVYNRPS